MNTKTALIVGSTGLIGNHLLQALLQNDQYHKVISLNRKSSGIQHEKYVEMIIDFDTLSTLSLQQNIDDAFCCLGTTMKKAGSKEAFYKVDYTYVIEFANLAKKEGAQTFQVVSAMGANAKSPFYYNQVKGMMEKELSKCKFSTLNIFQPSLLLGERNENRAGEDFGKVLNSLFSFMIPKKYKGIEGKKVAYFMIKKAQEINKREINFFTSDMMQ